jgi:hypothetical protein
MKPALAFPFNDPDGTMFSHLQAILPDLKKHFESAYICPPFSTRRHANHLQQLQADDFFTIFYVEREMQIGELFAYLYQRGETAHPDQIIHLCYFDRLAFPLRGANIEGIVTTVGRNLFARELDYAWCHLVVCAVELREIIPLVRTLV